ncbi:M4 family metallopeptidase [Nocardia transvalensis]|uniref:M4 family metallopeptidase n=1 Tax=Nocardia transvalensis TaxID=37333 RepID=UPI00189629FC|nr:M4 family metallopeptidase [Nocardia transvalensis]MBF6329182.1 M4 family metallopeptidase [Nocardia transvalensis]
MLTDSEGAVVQVVPKNPVPVPEGTPAEAPAAAQAHADGVEKVFTGDHVGDLVVDSTFEVGEGSTVRLRQEIDSVPVFGASAAQTLAADGSLLSVTGALSQKSQGKYQTTTPPAEVATNAVKAIAEQTQTPVEKLAVGEARAYWYDPKLAAKQDAQSVAIPAFQVVVLGDGAKGEGDESAKPGEWVVFIDAADIGKVLDSWDESKHLNRVVCDAERRQVDLNNPSSVSCGGPGGFRATRKEGQGPVNQSDVDNVYTYFGNTEGFYAKYTQLPNLTNLIGSDTGDGNGKALRGTVRICSATECPYANAFWYNGQMAYGEGVTTEDITGHELTHGVTEHTSGLVYRNEPGAINESMSDIFGELVFLTDTANPCNTPQNRWKLGACSSLGVIRDMQNPNAHRQPDTYQGQYWYTGSGDNGGVHTNSGVGNKAAQLMVDGGSHNGVNVTAIGLEKTAALYWTTQTILSSNSNYQALGSALSTACNTNVRNNVAGTTPQDCAQVVNATKAVEMPTLQAAA